MVVQGLTWGKSWLETRSSSSEKRYTRPVFRGKPRQAMGQVRISMSCSYIFPVFKPVKMLFLRLIKIRNQRSQARIYI